jgi:D-lyxose ketol-isomerase
MKRSDINHLIRSASACFQGNGWTLPQNAYWDVTDFGLGDWRKYGLVLVNLAEEPEYCEKLMYALEGMTTPAHTHRKKKEDIICRWGRLAIRLWSGYPESATESTLTVQVDRAPVSIPSGSVLELAAGSRVTLVPGVYHEFYPLTDECIIGEVSTANDDLTDNFFVNSEIGRYPGIEEDEAAEIRLVSEHQA